MSRTEAGAGSALPEHCSLDDDPKAGGLALRIVLRAARLGGRRPWVLTAVTAVLSNLVSNVPALLLLKPLVPALGDPERTWLILAMAATPAGNLTIPGSVANLIVVEAARVGRVEIGFVEYCKVGVPLTLVTLLLGWLLLGVLPR